MLAKDVFLHLLLEDKESDLASFEKRVDHMNEHDQAVEGSMLLEYQWKPGVYGFSLLHFEVCRPSGSNLERSCGRSTEGLEVHFAACGVIVILRWALGCCIFIHLLIYLLLA